MCSKSLYCLKTGVSFCLSSSSLKVYFIFDSLNSCEPEFLVSTPERLLELVNSKAIDISGVSLLVISFWWILSTFINNFSFYFSCCNPFVICVFSTVMVVLLLFSYHLSACPLYKNANGNLELVIILKYYYYRLIWKACLWNFLYLLFRMGGHANVNLVCLWPPK